MILYLHQNNSTRRPTAHRRFQSIWILINDDDLATFVTSEKMAIVASGEVSAPYSDRDYGNLHVGMVHSGEPAVIPIW